MAVGVRSWSTTAASNGNADASINFSEGQSPPSLNNSARALMAAVKALYNTIGGGITYGGSGNTYTATNDTPGVWSSYAEGDFIGFEPNATNSGAATLNVDGLGAKSIVKSASTALSSGDLVQGAFYLLRYDGTNFCVIGTAGAQPLDATLTALAGLTTADDRMLDFTGVDTMAVVTYATVRTNLAAYTAADSPTFGTITTTGAIELGNVSDTTLARSAAGKATLEGVAINLAGKQSVPIPASAMIANTTNGAASGTQESSTNKVMTRTLDFDTTTQEGAQFLFPMPKGWNESTVTFQPIWTAASGSGGVVWELRGVALSDDDAIDTAFGTGQTSTDTLITALDVHIGPESSAITIAGTPAEGDMVVFQIRRNVSDGSDTLGVDAKLIGIRLFITTDAANDA